MNKTLYELLVLLKDNIELVFSGKVDVYDDMKLGNFGLCHIVIYLRKNNIITAPDSILIIEYIKFNSPRYPKHGFTDFSWEPSKLEPRKKWLNDHIELNKPE